MVFCDLGWVIANVWNTAQLSIFIRGENKTVYEVFEAVFYSFLVGLMGKLLLIELEITITKRIFDGNTYITMYYNCEISLKLQTAVNENRV